MSPRPPRPRLRALLTALAAAALTAAIAVGCADDEPVTPDAPEPTATPAGPSTLVVLTHDSFDVTNALVAEFEREHNVKVQLIMEGDANELVNRAILNAGNPEGDVLFGVDNLRLPARRRGRRVPGVRGDAARRHPRRRARSVRRLAARHPHRLRLGRAQLRPFGGRAARHAGGADRAAMAGQARRRGPGDLVARPPVPRDHRRVLRRGALAGVLARPARERRASRTRLERRLLHALQHLRRRPPAGGLVHHEPGRRVLLLRGRAGGAADAQRHPQPRLPPSGGGRGARGHRGWRPRREVHRLPAQRRVPAADPPHDVRLPRDRRPRTADVVALGRRRRGAGRRSTSPTTTWSAGSASGRTSCGGDRRRAAGARQRPPRAGRTAGRALGRGRFRSPRCSSRCCSGRLPPSSGAASRRMARPTPRPSAACSATATYWERLVFTTAQAAASTAAALAVGLPAAYVFAHIRFPGRAAARALVTVPFVLPTLVVALSFQQLAGPDGLLNRALEPFGLGSVEAVGTIQAILAAHVFYNVSIVIRLVAGVWANLDPRAEEAARLLGAGRWATLREVTLPALAPGHRLGGGARVRLLVHILRRRAGARRAGTRHARGRDLPPRDPARRTARGGRAVVRADRRHRRGARRVLAAPAPHRPPARAAHRAARARCARPRGPSARCCSPSPPRSGC